MRKISVLFFLTLPYILFPIRAQTEPITKLYPDTRATPFAAVRPNNGPMISLAVSSVRTNSLVRTEFWLRIAWRYEFFPKTSPHQKRHTFQANSPNDYYKQGQHND